MLIALGFVVIFATFWTIFFLHDSLFLSFIALILILGVFTYFKIWPLALLIPFWIVFLGFGLLFNIPILRRHFFSKYILRYFRKVQPQISATEKIALEAGETWWEGELFCGRPNWKKLLKMPQPKLSAEEQAFIDNEVDELCEKINDWQIVHDYFDMPKEVWDYLKTHKFFGLVIAKKYQGHGFSALAHSSIVTKIASRSMSVAVNTMVPNSLGPAELIHLYGTPEQKKYYLPRLAKGKEIPCFALTSPVAGSDATSIIDNGIVCKGEFEGKTIIGVKLNWNKRYITLAPIATLLGLAFKMYDPEHLLGDEENIGITLCLIPTHHPGVEMGERHIPLHLAFLNGPTRGKDVFIPLDWLIGGPDLRGQGWHMMVECLAVGRGISLPALGTAVAQVCFRAAGAYSQIRNQFHVPIGKLEGIQEFLANIGGLTYLSEATRIMTASAVDQNIKPSLASAITKYHLTEIGRIIINEAMDIFAGKGIQLGPKNIIGLIYDIIPTSVTVEGANILTRNLIIFGQGAIRCHPYVRKEIAASKISNPKQALKQFDKLLAKHLGFAVSNFVRTISYSLTGGRLIRAPKSKAAKYYRQLTRMSCALSLISDLSMALLGSELKRLERLSARLGDVLSYLYMASAVLRYYENHQQAASDLPFVHWSVQWCLANIQKAFDEFCENFPRKILGWILHKIIFPLGKAYQFPADKLGKQIAEIMQQPSSLRDRLTGLCYLGKNLNDGMFVLEQAFQKIIQSEYLKTKLQNAIHTGLIIKESNYNRQLETALNAGILTTEEIKLLQESAWLQEAAIQVDEFEANSLARKKTDGRRKNQT